MAEFSDLPQGASVRALPDSFSDLPEGASVRKSSAKDKATAVAAGTNVGLAKAFGAPVDLLNAGMGAIGIPTSDEPVLGSDWIRGVMGKVGLGYEDINELPADQQPYAYGGEVVGMSAPVAAAPFAAAGRMSQLRQLAPSRGPIDDMVRTAGNKPGQFAGAEAASTAGAATLGGVVSGETENPLARMGAEVAGGVTPALALAASVKTLKTMVAGWEFVVPSKVNVENTAADRLARVFDETGEDAAAVAATRDDSFGQVSSTAFVDPATGEPTVALTALETALREASRRGSRELQEQTDSAIAEAKRAFAAAAEGGDPAALRRAAAARTQYYLHLLDSRVVQAETSAAEAAARLGGDVKAADASAQVRGILEDALKDARATERQLWREINRDTLLAPTRLKSAYEDVREQLLTEEGMSAPVEAFMRTLQDEMVDTGLVDAAGKAITRQVSPESNAGDLLRFRSRMLELARDASAQQRYGDAQRFNRLADGALADLSSLEGDAVDVARTFSRELHDRFSRGVPGRILRPERSGGNRVEPEQTLDRAMPGGRAGAVGAEQVRQAGTPVPGSAAPDRSGDIARLQEQYLRDAAEKTIGPDGRVSPAKLRSWQQRNAETLEQFPELRDQVLTAENIERVAADQISKLKGVRRAMEQRGAYARLAGVEDPAEAFSSAMRGDTPQKSVAQLLLVAKGNPEAAAGARAAMFDALSSQPGMTARLGDFRGVMQRSGVFSEAQLNRLQRISQQIDNMEQALSTHEGLDSLADGLSPLADLGIRIAGSWLGTHTLLGSSAASTMIASAAMIRTLRNYTEAMPMSRVQNLLLKAMEDPEVMQMLLTKVKTVNQAERKVRQIHAYLVQQGFAPEDEQEN